MGGLEGQWPRPQRWPLLFARQKMLPGEVGRTAWEERADGPADAVGRLFGADPEEGKALGGLEEPWPRRRRWPCCATMPVRQKIKIAGLVL